MRCSGRRRTGSRCSSGQPTSAAAVCACCRGWGSGSRSPGRDTRWLPSLGGLEKGEFVQRLASAKLKAEQGIVWRDEMRSGGLDVQGLDAVGAVFQAMQSGWSHA